MKKILFGFFILLLLVPSFVFAQEESVFQEEVFEARVIKILDENRFQREDGSEVVQQNVLLRGLEGLRDGEEVTFYGISDVDVVKLVNVKEGNRVMVSVSENFEGGEDFYIIDHVRRTWLYLLGIIFVILMIVVGRWKGVKSLLSLGITFLVIMKMIIPSILNGRSPLLMSILGAILILGAIVYITWGFTRKSHIALVSIALSLFATGLISILFTSLTKLTGAAQEEVMFLVGISNSAINFQGLLLAGIIIGTLGVLDDVVIAQISTIEQLKCASKKMKVLELFKRGMKVGVDHISSMTNTLFLAYAGASLPLLLLFTIYDKSFVQVINNEIIATEIVRTLTGSIGLILAMPLSTIIAAFFIKKTD